MGKLAATIRTKDYQRQSRLVSLAIVKEDATDYCNWYWDRAWLRSKIERLGHGSSWKEQQQTYWKIARLYKRWQRFKHWVKEVKPQWKDTGKEIYFADNSIEKVQIDRDGNTRNVMTKSPSGDVC